MTCVRLAHSFDVTRSFTLTVYQSFSMLNSVTALQDFIENKMLLVNKSTSYVFDTVLDTLVKENINFIGQSC